MSPGIPKGLFGKRFWVSLVALFCLLPPSFAQRKLDQLLVYGENFTFSVKEPSGWNGDTTNAQKFQSNVVLHESGQPTDSALGLIRISMNEKVDEDTGADLKADMRDYKAQYPTVQFRDIPAKNPNYLCLAKLFYVPGKFYEYVAYVNPGPQKPVLFSVSMKHREVRSNYQRTGSIQIGNSVANAAKAVNFAGCLHSSW